MSRKQIWKKILIRNTLYIYARDSLLFFMNLYIWSQGRDLQQVALFNLAYMFIHTLAFPLFLPIVKRQKAQALMRVGVAGITAVLLSIAVLQERSQDYLYLLGGITGLFNGMYWLTNHVYNFDQTSNASRASFFSFKTATSGIGKLAVPFVGWLMFVLLGDGQAGYNGIFTIATVASLAAIFLVELPQDKESDHSMRDSFAHLWQTPYMKLKLFSNFFWGLALRSAMAKVLLPFLIFQIVEKESSLSFVQTGIEVFALFASYMYGRYKKNTQHLSKLFNMVIIAAIIGLSALLIDLSATTFTIYAAMHILALSAGNTSAGTMSNNFATTIKNHKEHRAEYLVLRELFTIPGFMAGHVFVYFFADDLSINSLRPLIVAMMVATVIAIVIQRRVWEHTIAVGGTND